MKAVTRTLLIADEGKLLTDGKAFGKSVYLAEGADASAWSEISEEEYEALAKSEGEV